MKNASEEKDIMGLLIKCVLAFGVGFILFLIKFFICEAIASRKSKRVGPVTRIPIIPFNQDNLYIFKGTRDMKNVIPEAKIQCCNDRLPWHIWDPNCSSIQIMNSIMLWIFDLDRILPDEYKELTTEHGHRYYQKKPKNSVPTDARTISIKMENFKHGLKCHDFVPIYGTSPGSYYTFQMFGDNRIQVTNYVEHGISYVAGFCIYFEHSDSYGVSYNEQVMKDCLNSQKYLTRNYDLPPQNTHVTTIDLECFNDFKQEPSETEVGIPCEEGCSGEENTTVFNQISGECSSVSYQISHQNEVPLEQMTIKYCPKLQRHVMSGLESGIVIHKEWSDKENKMKSEECQMCTEVLNDEDPPAYSSLSLP